MADEGLKLFGFEIKRSKKTEPAQAASVVPPTDDDGAGYVSAAAHYYGHYYDIDGTNDAKDNHQLIHKYRNVSQQPECDMAIDEIVNEAIIANDNEPSVELNLEKLEASDKIKKLMAEEFRRICNLLNFKDNGHEMFRSWYVDGRIYHHLIVDDKNMKAGIKEIRHIDSAKIRKVKNVKYKKDEKTGAKLVDTVEEFYIFQDKPGNQNNGVKLSTDSISYITSGVMDEKKSKVLSHLHKAIKPVNQLRMMEDSLVIYRLARAPERRIFYIDTGNLPRGKAEEYMKNIMTRYRNKLVYDANTGQLKDDRKHMSMLEDFWLPRKEGNRGTEISTLPGGQNLGEIEDIIYFQKKLYRALNVPVNRLEQEAQYSLGRSNEITRDEIKFQKFIDRLRNRFSKLFIDILRKQLIIKGVITEEDWEDFRYDIFVDYQQDNHYSELKNTEILRERLQNMDQVTQYVGEYFSKEWVYREILKMSEDEIAKMQKEIGSEGPVEPPQEQQQQQEYVEYDDEIINEDDNSASINLEEQEKLASMEMMETVTQFLKNGA